MVSVPTATHFGTIIKSVNDEVDRLPSLRKISTKSRRLFAVDLSLVALSVRTGYLLDVFAPRHAIDVFSRLLSVLRLAHPVFETVTHVYEPTSDQSFFVNISKLFGKELSEEAPSTTIPEFWVQRDHTHERNVQSFVRLYLDQRCELLGAPPVEVTSILQSLKDDLANALSAPLSKTLPSTLSQDTAIPIAAVLIGYPVAYVPASPEQMSFLSNVPLDVYECLLTFNDSLQVSNPHTLLKFSCPSGITKKHPDVLGPSRIIERLTATFQPRLQRAVPGTELVVRQSSETLDRVAL